MKTDYIITVLFGSDQVRKFHNNEIFDEDEINQYTKTYSFATKRELDAFVLGIESANGWLDLIYFEGMEIQKSKVLQNKLA